MTFPSHAASHPVKDVKTTSEQIDAVQDARRLIVSIERGIQSYIDQLRRHVQDDYATSNRATAIAITELETGCLWLTKARDDLAHKRVELQRQKGKE